MKKTAFIGSLILFICLIFLACGGESRPDAASEAPTPAPTEEPAWTAEPVPEPEIHTVIPVETEMPEEDPVTPAPTPVPETLPPMPTPTPVPTPTPTPTPEPTPTPIPYLADEESNRKTALSLDTESFMTVSTKSGSPSVLRKPDPNSDRIMPFTRVEGVYTHEWIVLDVVEGSRTYYHLRPIGAQGDGYLEARYVNDTALEQPESTYAMLVRPYGIVYAARTLDSGIVAHAGYEVVRVIGVDNASGFAAVLTSEGKTGYVQLGQIRFLSEDAFETYLHQSCEAPECAFSVDALVEDAQEYLGKPYLNAADFLFDLLRAEGLHFNEGYYVFYQKPLDDETLYPKHLYVTGAYNTLTFKLFNSAGDLVTADGEETEWAYVGSFEEIMPGDLLFFSDESDKGSAVIPDVEVVMHGRYSGDVTGCGLYAGDGQMFTVKNGVVADVEIDPITAKTFDSARRIYPRVTDEKAHFIEVMISMIYDRLGTPYNSVRRIGDASYDCSGLLTWVFRSLGYRRGFRNEIVLDLTATQFGHLDYLVSDTHRITFVDTGITERDSESLSSLQRGDFVVLLTENRSKIGHVMVYLGNNTVIHSTTIDGRYRGTLVAKFRPHLINLYASSRRIDEITPLE